MASRRSKVIRSSSQGEIGLFNQIIAIDSPTPISNRLTPAHSAVRRAPNTVPMQQPRTAVPKKQQLPKKTIFMLGSPERRREIKKDEGFGIFFQNCSLCKKKLKPHKDIYIYGYLGAFCSIDCRDDRIALDGIDNEVVPNLPINMRPSKRF
ncbi:uncharacterized protein LOC128280490 [Gossypium arboreum]|uniref:FLZ-type domain-containing protein n=1 Tax=Gossypium arboreum TaxID=29729 RepID=A0ABR0NUI9_GOSAR|nr:uncharacterized protein LOC128280490 [Gossypium arboreum]KAK5804995.1 hypothetical protein PVK06_032647 [Gossypium arboreum]